MIKKVKDWMRLPSRRLVSGTFGVEIEVECPHGNYFNPEKYWTRTRDGSLENGMEYVLSSPLDLDSCKRALMYFTREKNKAGLDIQKSVRCGVHVHANVQEFTMPQLFNFIVLTTIFEGVLVNYCGESRRGNLFCLGHREAEFQNYALRRFLDSPLPAALTNDDLRYSFLNITSLPKFGSLEFRAMRTPHGRGAMMRVLDWVKIINDLRESALRFPDPINIVQNFSGNSCEDFLQDVFPNTHQLLNFPDLQAEMTECMRYAQDLAYHVENWDKFNKKSQKNPFKLEVEF